MSDAWKEISQSDLAACLSFLTIMQNMDQRHRGMTAAQLSTWLEPSQGYNAFGWVSAASTPVELMEVCILGRFRGDNRAPDIAMLGWLPHQAQSIDTIAQKVIGQSTAWAQSLGQDTVRCAVPKQMDSPWILQLHQKLYEALTSSPSVPRIIRRVDLGDSWLWYVKA